MPDEDPDNDGGEHNIFRDGKIHILSEKCKTCIFTPATRPVRGTRVAGVVRDTMATAGATVVWLTRCTNEITKVLREIEE